MQEKSQSLAVVLTSASKQRGKLSSYNLLRASFVAYQLHIFKTQFFVAYNIKSILSRLLYILILFNALQFLIKMKVLVYVKNLRAEVVQQFISQ